MLKPSKAHTRNSRAHRLGRLHSHRMTSVKARDAKSTPLPRGETCALNALQTRLRVSEDPEYPEYQETQLEA